MVLQGNKAQVEARFSPFRGRANMTQDRCMVCAKRITGSEIIWTHPMELLSDVDPVESRFSPFGDNVRVSAR
jgi:hypothetical protein